VAGPGLIHLSGDTVLTPWVEKHVGFPMGFKHQEGETPVVYGKLMGIES
jgi:hypothetical protein